MVTLKEMSNGTLYIDTPAGKYISHFRPNSPLVEQLVEKYNVNYKYSNGSTINNVLLGAIVLMLIATAIVVKKREESARRK
ncbi:hypothetical protein ACI2OX_16535 [Bacillus sp. N9]